MVHRIFKNERAFLVLLQHHGVDLPALFKKRWVALFELGTTEFIRMMWDQKVTIEADNRLAEAALTSMNPEVIFYAGRFGCDFTVMSSKAYMKAVKSKKIEAVLLRLLDDS